MYTHQVGEKRHIVVLDDVSEMYALGYQCKKECDRYAAGWRYNADSILRHTRTGREDLVRVADDMLANIEDQIPLSKGWRNIDDVVGAVPNVPAFLAGHPQCMRRRERTNKDNAPVTMFVDISASAAVSDNTMIKRGAAMLALVRMLSQVRPVELWAGVMWSDPGVACSVVWKIDTMPLDLARAAVHLADPRTSRVFGFGVASTTAKHNLRGRWTDMPTRFAELKALQGWPDDTLYVPHIHLHDPLSSNPVGFVRRELSKYTGQGE